MGQNGQEKQNEGQINGGKKVEKEKSEMERKRAVRRTKNSNTPFHAFRTKRLTEICTEPESNVCYKISTREQQLEEIETRVKEKCLCACVCKDGVCKELTLRYS